MRWNRRNGCMGVIWQGVNWDHLFSWAVYILFHPKLQIIFDQKNVQMSKSKRQSLTILYYSLYISFTSRRNIRYIDYVQNNIQTCQCRIRDQADCPRPRTFYQSFDPENPCCPKYNCICTGVTDGTNRYHKDQLAYYYGNCTIIQERFLVFKFKPLIIQTNWHVKSLKEKCDNWWNIRSLGYRWIFQRYWRCLGLYCFRK